MGEVVGVEITRKRDELFTETRFAGHRALIVETQIDGLDTKAIDVSHESALAKGTIRPDTKDLDIRLTDPSFSPETWAKVRGAVEDIISLWEEYKAL